MSVGSHVLRSRVVALAVLAASGRAGADDHRRCRLQRRSIAIQRQAPTLPEETPNQPDRSRRRKPRPPAGWRASHCRRRPRRPRRLLSAPSSAGISGGGRGLASYSPTSTPTYSSVPSQSLARPSAAVSPDITGSVTAPKPASSNWSRDGGTAITVTPGETIDSIARRYGVPASAIIQANNLTQPAAIRPGQQLVIPRYSNSSTRRRRPRPAPAHISPPPLSRWAAASRPPSRRARPAIRACTWSRRARR